MGNRVAGGICKLGHVSVFVLGWIPVCCIYEVALELDMRSSHNVFEILR